MDNKESPDEVDFLSNRNTLDQYLNLNPTINPSETPLGTRPSTPINAASNSLQEEETKRQSFLQDVIHLTLVNEGRDDVGEDQSQRSSSSKALVLDGRNHGGRDDSISASTSTPTTWRVMRYKLSPPFVQKMLQRSLSSHEDNATSATLAYLKDSQDGTIIAPPDMQKLCKPPPSMYYVILAAPNRTKDVLTRQASSTKALSSSSSTATEPAYFYQGDMKFVLRHVPQYSQSETYTVTEKSIKQWIIHSIIAEDPSVLRMEQQLKEEDRQYKQIMFQIRKVKTEPILMGNGTMISNRQKAEQERQLQLEKLEHQMKQLYKTHEESIKSLRDLKRKVAMEVQLEATMDQVDESSNRSSWTIRFLGSLREFHEYVVVQKSDWNTIPMYAWRSKSTQTDMIGDDELDDLLVHKHSKRVAVESISNYLVDTAGITVERLEHGFGCYQRNAREEDEIELTSSFRNENVHAKQWKSFQSHIDVHYGSYEEGMKSGNGIVFTSTHIYGGNFDRDLPNGEGVLIHENGDVWKGQFDHSMKTKGSDGVSNRYARGLPHGYTNISFSDGAFYEGEVKQGEITGKGVYVSAIGDVLEGEFMRGSLVKGTRYFNNTGDSMDGEYKAGLLNGNGVYRSKNKRSIYTGEFLDDQKHGQGREVYTSCKDETIKHTYEGFFWNGHRSGNGCMDFTDRYFGSPNKGKWCLQGEWIAGRPRPGGMITNMESHYSTPTNRFLSNFRWLSRLKKAEGKKDEERNEVLQHDQKVGEAFLKAIEHEKSVIFQRHRQSSLHKVISNRNKHRTVDSAQKDKLEEVRTRLSSRSSFYTHHILSSRPTSIVEAKERPGLSLILCEPSNKDTLLAKLSSQLKNETKRRGLSYQKMKVIKHVEEEFNDMEENLGMIDVSQLYTNILGKYGRR